MIWKIHSILKSKKKTLSNSDEQKAHKRKMKFPCFLLDLEKWPVFRYYNIIFHFHEASVWNCLFFQRLVLKLDNEWFYFFRIVMYGHYTHKQKRYKYQKNKKSNAGKWKNQVELTTVSVLYGRMLGIWAIIEHYQISFVKFARKHSYIIFFRWIACLVIINEQN